MLLSGSSDVQREEEMKLPKKFDTYPEALKADFMRFGKIREDGGHIVGTVCTYAPVELIIAAGAYPITITTIDNATVPAAEKHLPKNFCPMLTATFGSALTEVNPVYYNCDFIFAETSCDGRKKMYEILNEYKEVHTMHLPQGATAPGAFEYMYGEVVRAKEFLEERLGVEITDEKLREGIKLTNEERKAAADFYELGKLSPCPMSGTEMIQAAFFPYNMVEVQDRIDHYRKRTAELKKQYDEGAFEPNNKPRILLTGCPLVGVADKLVPALEEAGAEIVMLENCCALREKKDLIDETKDPLTAIAEKYMKIPCAVMTPNPARIDDFDKYIDEFRIDGVVELVLQTCNPFALETDINRRFITEKKGVPYLSIETDFSDNDKGQISTRIGAFIEIIESNK